MNAFAARWGVVSLLVLGSLGTGCSGSNRTPVVTEGPLASMKNVEAGAQIQMHLVVTDADGDPLSYQWTQAPAEPAGAFSDTSVREPNWTAPEVTEPHDFLLKVIIQDSEGPLLLSWTSVNVRPR